MGTSAAGAHGVAPALSGLWTIEREDLGVVLRLEQESIDAVVILVAHKIFATTVGSQFMLQTEHLDIFWMTSTLQPCRSA